MRPTRALAPALVLLAAMACSSISTTTKSKPAPAPAPAPAQKQGKSTAATLGIPPGHLPPPGQCRVWMPGEPPGHQAKARSCANIERSAPAGSWIVYRPTEDKKVVHVKVVDQSRPGVVVHVRIYDLASGSLIREG
jgi:hypothetical protein